LQLHAVLPELCHLSVDEDEGMLPSASAAVSTALVKAKQQRKTISIFLAKADPDITWESLASELLPIK